MKESDMELQAHQQRVVEEKAELDVKTGKLTSFIDTSTFAGLTDAEKDRLVLQLHHMRQYAAVLGARIAAF